MTEKENNKAQTNTNKPDQPSAKISASDAARIAAKAKQQAQGSSKSKTVSPPTKQTVKTAPKAPTKSSPIKQKLSKTALLALLIAVSAGGGVGANYWWQQQQNNELEQRLAQNTKTSVIELDQHLQQQISALQKQSQQQINKLISDVEKRSGSRISALEQEIEQLIDSQPNNWQITEAEYLTRMAGRVLWLEKDASTAITLMNDADARIKDLKDPRMMKVRELLHEDIEKLKTLPKLQRDDIILTLMGLSKQVDDLTLATVQLPEETELKESTALTEDVSDWQENLAKSWAKFKDEFITVRRRSGNVEPLMEPKFEQNLYHNLELKFQQAQWAVSQGKKELFLTTVTDIQRWLSLHFDMTQVKTQQFNARLAEIKAMPVTVEYPQTLASQQALRAMLDNKPSKRLGGVKPQPLKTKKVVTKETEVIEPKAEPEQKPTPLNQEEGAA
ncbi:uroporphyrinogen-III C-methyltransferase [Thalassotalea psychrophila]|uniref:Uroporphyrinogen-III C-methyltransferase n=1 Tax=Thalassotalea psychrophila TaxID=3065647 RepID=A0ABY9TU42_9GAMM|nr:uroporphyrinogen-III C-methyltransferase [Colwelliaceae bacterium SQ149]